MLRAKLFLKKEMAEEIIRNPITDWIKNSVNTSSNRLNFAIPFLSSFSSLILNKQSTKIIKDKRIITKFDDSSINSFDLQSLKHLLDLGFDIRYDNRIHLKLYITDNDAYVTSSNLTKGGFEDNIELTIKVDSTNIENCRKVFENIWLENINNKLSYKLIENNWSKYEILRKRDSYNKKTNKEEINVKQIKIGILNIKLIIDEIFNQENDFIREEPELAFEANKLREKTKEKLKKGFDSKTFYAPEGHKLRRKNLFYDFVYGYEFQLAGTGLRELQFQTAFEHPGFKKVIEYIYPEMIGMKPWNLRDKDILLEFCNGIFDFKIPQYIEALPIRLASYFYPEQFIPIFKLEHLEQICESFGLKTNAETHGDRLYAYNLFIGEQMSALPYDNNVKSNFSYRIMYVVELYKRLSQGENYNEILNDYKQNWKKRFIRDGMEILKKLKIVK
ncbi:MAG: hypothetical protein HYR76_00810 [Ignavibacteria bacterium]|nr:hypothetical protein [Ignavibacteria bacterium]